MANVTINSLTAKTTPADADETIIIDSAASYDNKKVTFANIKAFIKAYTDTLYATTLGANDNYVSDAQLVVIGNTSGTNTGDQNLSGLVPYTGATADLNLGTHEVITSSVHANSSAGVTIHNTSGQDVAMFGSGGGINGTLYGNLSMNTANKIVNMADPTSAQDGSTKAYSDTKALLAGSTSQTFSASQFEVGNTDTTITRIAAGQIAVEGVAVPTISSTNTLTNKAITKRVASTTDSATATINCDNYDEYYLTAIANNTTISITGTPIAGQTIFIGLKDAGTTKTLTWTSITGLGQTLPTATTATKQHIIGLKYIASAWKAIAVNVEV